MLVQAYRMEFVRETIFSQLDSYTFCHAADIHLNQVRIEINKIDSNFLRASHWLVYSPTSVYLCNTKTRSRSLCERGQRRDATLPRRCHICVKLEAATSAGDTCPASCHETGERTLRRGPKRKCRSFARRRNRVDGLRNLAVSPRARRCSDEARRLAGSSNPSWRRQISNTAVLPEKGMTQRDCEIFFTRM